MSRTKYQITAIIYDKRGKVLSIGKNSYIKTHPLMKLHACKAGLPHKEFLHAEVHAIVKCKRLDKAHRIEVMRFDKQGNEMNAKPCPVCQSAIAAAGITVIQHT